MSDTSPRVNLGSWSSAGRGRGRPWPARVGGSWRGLLAVAVVGVVGACCGGVQLEFSLAGGQGDDGSKQLGGAVQVGGCATVAGDRASGLGLGAGSKDALD